MIQMRTLQYTFCLPSTTGSDQDHDSSLPAVKKYLFCC